MTTTAGQARIPSVLFVCVRNGGKSQMAAALMRLQAGDRVEVHSAGTDPGKKINALAAEVVAELGADMSGQVPTAVDPDLARRVDRVVVLGAEATLDLGGHHDRNGGDDGHDDGGKKDDDDNDAVTPEVWLTDEPSERGIDGPERMRLIRDDIAGRVATLLDELTGEQTGEEAPS